MAISGCALLVGCGPFGGDQEDSPTAAVPTTPTTPPDVKRRANQYFKPPCGGVAGISVDESSDLTGKANTLERVRRVWRAHKDELLRGCSGTVGGGIGKLGKRPNPRSKRYVIDMLLKSARFLPDERLFIEGVPVRFVVSGPIRIQPQ